MRARIAARANNAIEPIEDERRIVGGEERVQPGHAVGRRLELDPPLRECLAVPFGEGLGHDLFAQMAGLAAHGRGGVRHRQLGEQLVEPGAGLAIVVAEVARLLDDDPGVLHRDRSVAECRQRRRERRRQRRRLIDLSLHRALGYAQRRRQFGGHAAVGHLAPPLGRQGCRDERLGTCQGVAHGEEEHIDPHRGVHRLDPLRRTDAATSSESPSCAIAYGDRVSGAPVLTTSPQPCDKTLGNTS